MGAALIAMFVLAFVLLRMTYVRRRPSSESSRWAPDGFRFRNRKRGRYPTI